MSRGLKVDQLVYLKTEPETSLKRVIKRNRPGEVISLEYLQNCHERHERWLQKRDGVLLLNGERDIDETFNYKLLAIKVAIESWNKTL